MGNNIKHEINKIPIPKELHQRTIQGIQRAKREMEIKNNDSSRGHQYKLKMFVGFVAMVSLLISGSVLIEKEQSVTKSALPQTSEPAQELLITNADTLNSMENNVSIMAERLLYNSFSDLKRDAKVIVEGDVIESLTVNREGHIQTHSKVRVWKDYKQVLKKDDVITFIEQGGVTTLANQQPVEVMFDVPVMKLGERVLIFATKEKKEGEEVYLPLGEYQGKFMVENDVFQRFVPYKLEGKYLSLRTTRSELENILAN